MIGIPQSAALSCRSVRYPRDVLCNALNFRLGLAPRLPTPPIIVIRPSDCSEHIEQHAVDGFEHARATSARPKCANSRHERGPRRPDVFGVLVGAATGFVVPRTLEGAAEYGAKPDKGRTTVVSDNGR